MLTKFLIFLVGAVLLLVGIPGVISDIHTWYVWLKEWAWWNYVLSSIGVLVCLWAIFDSYQGFITKHTQSESTDLKQTKAADNLPKKAIANINEYLVNVFKWYDSLPDAGPLQAILHLMLAPILIACVFFLIMAPFIMFVELLTFLGNKFF